ncbi:MAG: DedA family protein [Dehalococcoidia bacterium]
MGSVEQVILQWVQAVYQALGWPGLVAMMAIESACIPLPSEVVMPLGGWLLVQAKGGGLGGLLLAGFLGALGNLLGSLLAYWAGAVWGRAAVLRWGKWVLITPHDVERADRWFTRYGEATVFFSRLLPVVRTFISLPAGVARMHLGKFCLYTFLGAFPWSLGLAWGGFLLGEHWERLRAAMRPFDIPILVAMVALGVWWLWRRFRHIRKEASQAAASSEDFAKQRRL